jgi:3-hydroxyacyl-CoA dehydrogenase
MPMPIKVTRIQRQTLQRAISLMDRAQLTIEEVHDELCEKYTGTTATGPKVVANMEATSAISDVMSQLIDAMNMAQELLKRPKRTKKRMEKRTTRSH